MTFLSSKKHDILSSNKHDILSSNKHDILSSKNMTFYGYQKHQFYDIPICPKSKKPETPKNGGSKGVPLVHTN